MVLEIVILYDDVTRTGLPNLRSNLCCSIIKVSTWRYVGEKIARGGDLRRRKDKIERG